MLTKTRDPLETLTTSVHSRKRRISPLMIVGMCVPVLLLLIAGGMFLLPYIGSKAATSDNPNCSLRVPQRPLTAQGLATPYQLFATNAADGPCNEANAAQSAFVQAAILDPATGQITIYNPLVINRGTQPAAMPVVPQLPANAVVGIWFGFNGDVLQLRGDLRGGNCVNGIRGSNFGQFAYCNAPAFFQATNAAIQAGQLTPPALGMARDGRPCMTTRDYGLVDMDPSDNVTTNYLITANGLIAQDTAANRTTFQNAQVQVNPSDNRVLNAFVDVVLGCTPWMAPSLEDPGQMVPALPLNELFAAAHQALPIAFVPAGDPMVLDNNGKPNLQKLNLYRAGVNQPAAPSLNDPEASTTAYCQSMIDVQIPRLQLDRQLFQNAQSPDPAAANNLFTFLAQRLSGALGADGGLNCLALLNIQNPVQLMMDNNGVVINATFNGQSNGNGQGNGMNMGDGQGNSGGVQQIARGKAQFTLGANKRSVAVKLNITKRLAEAPGIQTWGEQVFLSGWLGRGGQVIYSSVFLSLTVL